MALDAKAIVAAGASVPIRVVTDLTALLTMTLRSVSPGAAGRPTRALGRT
jgi:hypothetical protein